jgi:hypothetical protein
MPNFRLSPGWTNFTRKPGNKTVCSEGDDEKWQKKAPEDIQGLLAGSSWLLHIKQICIKNQGKEAGIVLISLIQEITYHQPLIRLDL